jgi:hypothetical protein
MNEGDVPRSALSGKEIQEGQKVTLRVSFDDGVSREVDVAASEAEQLRTRGRDLTPWYTDLGRKSIRPAVWVLALAVTSLLIPAITKQWADRPKELELRTSLVDRIGESAAQTINTARFIVADTLPEATVRAFVCGEEFQGAEQSEKCNNRKEEETRAEQTAHVDAKTAWLQKGAVLESQLAAYFPGSDLSREGKGYVNAVRIYLFMASAVCGKKREDANDKLLRYLGEDPSDKEWAPLYGMTEGQCAQKSDDVEFRSVYGPLGDRMMAKRLDLLVLLNESDAEGFSIGFMDFLGDALPAVLLLLLAGIVVFIYVLRVRRRTI